MSAERSEAPTPRRREDARKKGNVARSQDLVSVGTLLVAVIGMRFAGPALWGDMRDILGEGLSSQSDQELTASTAYQLARDSGVRMLLALAPLFAMVMLAGVALNLGQTGLMFSGSGIKPKMNVLNPASGAKKLFGKEATVSLAKALAKMGTITVVVYLTMKGQLAAIAGMSLETPAQATAHMAQLSFDIAIRAAVVLFLIGAADWAWQRRQWMSNLKMTKEEVRQEIKETDGDPQVKAAIRRRRNALLNRMIASVPKADVVVTNPTHFAVALKYDPVSMAAPMVVAKGQDLLAQRIREVARKNGVPVLEEPPLARALYGAVPVGQYVPANLFHAVAEVLAWVYALRAKASRVTGNRTAPQGAN